MDEAGLREGKHGKHATTAWPSRPDAVGGAAKAKTGMGRDQFYSAGEALGLRTATPPHRRPSGGKRYAEAGAAWTAPSP